MFQFPRLKSEGIVEDVHYKTCTEDREKRSDTDRAAEQPVDQCNSRPQQYTNNADGYLRQLFLDNDHQTVLRTAAKFRLHIRIDAEVNDQKAEKQQNDSEQRTMVFGIRGNVYEKLCKPSGNQCIEHRCKSDAFSEKKLYEYRCDGNKHHCAAVVQWCML